MIRPHLLLALLLVVASAVDAGVNPANAKHRKRCKACTRRHLAPNSAVADHATSPSTSTGSSSSSSSRTRSSSSSSSPPYQSPSSASVNATSYDAPIPSSSYAPAASSSSSPAPSSSADVTASSSDYTANGKVYSVTDRYAGETFFSGFDFQSFPDPTHGSVNYVDVGTARNKGLAYVQDDGTFVMKVDDTGGVDANGNRNSVRIQSKKSFSTGLLVLDVIAMPYGCGVWPAFWTVGPNWPNGGEIDIVEGVNNDSTSQYTLHTATGCTVDESNISKSSRVRRSAHAHRESRHANHRRQAHEGHMQSRADLSPLASGRVSFTGRVLSTNCDAAINSNTGCGIKDSNEQSYGKGLNDAGGGVHAMLLDEHGVAIWFFPRSAIPQDLTNGKPQPGAWGSPKAFWSSSQCPTGQFFKDQNIVINTTLCGDWAGSAFASAGCGNSCTAFIQDPNNLHTAAWKIKSVTVYN